MNDDIITILNLKAMGVPFCSFKNLSNQLHCYIEVSQWIQDFSRMRVLLEYQCIDYRSKGKIANKTVGKKEEV